MKSLKASDIRGITLIEILIAMAIVVGLIGLGLFISIDFYKSYNFNSERDIIVNILQKARSQSLSNINESKHGVYFKTDEYVIFQGETYSSRNPAYDENIKTDPAIGRSGLQEIVFEQLTGQNSTSGNILISDGVRSSQISIQNEGRINW